MPEDISSLQRRVKELEEFHHLAESLSSIVSVYGTLEAIIDCCLKLCRAERGAILLIDQAQADVAQTIVRGATETTVEIDHSVNTLVAGWIMHHQKPFLTDDLIDAFGLKSHSERVRQLGSALAVPLRVQEKIIGIINLVNRRGGERFTEDALRILSGIAPLAAHAIHRARMHESLSQDNLRLRGALKQEQARELLLGNSASIQSVREKIAAVAASSATVLLIGETGTGKELVAQSIHLQSSRAHQPFYAINCAAIPATLFESELFGHEKGSFTGATEMRKGVFEQAHGGTLFLDEISAMPLELQPKLLRVLEERVVSRVGSSEKRKIDVRIIAASNKDLSRAVAAGEFRQDLFHRLNVVPIVLPPFRDRLEDIPILAQTFLNEFSDGVRRFAPDALELLSRLPWPGNVRELRNLVERVSIFCSSLEISAAQLRDLGIGADHFPASELADILRSLIRANSSQNDLLESIEKQLVEVALKETQGNVSRASQLLGIDRNALQRRIEKFGLEKSG